MRKIIILLLLMNGRDALLAWRKEGCGICGGGAEHGGAGGPAAGLRRRRRGGQVAEKARSVSK